jgi:hypothetical protein
VLAVGSSVCATCLAVTAEAYSVTAGALLRTASRPPWAEARAALRPRWPLLRARAPCRWQSRVRQRNSRKQVRPPAHKLALSMQLYTLTHLRQASCPLCSHAAIPDGVAGGACAEHLVRYFLTYS